MFKILVVEDDRELNRTVCAYLRGSGYTAVGCLDAGAAYDAMYGGQVFDCIIKDCGQQAADGGRADAGRRRTGSPGRKASPGSPSPSTRWPGNFRVWRRCAPTSSPM